jgi:hypothetical protein
MQAMTTPQTPLGADPGYTPKPRMPNGLYWLLATAGVLVLSLVASWWASSIGRLSESTVALDGHRLLTLRCSSPTRKLT